MEIPSVTYSSVFGPVSKVRWYKVLEYFNTYDVDLYITTSRVRSSQVRIENRANTTGSEWSSSIPANTNQAVEYRQANILHVPQVKALEYVVINQAIQ